MKLTGINSYTSWMVAVACSTINCLNLSPYRLAGLMYVAILERYNTDRQKASIPIILFILVRSLAGPAIGLLGQKYGLEEITLIGCFVTAVGFGGSYFAEDIAVVAVFLGVVYGIGITFGNTLLPNILKKHFTKNFNSATGVYTAGSCVGAFIFPPVAVFLLKEYGVSGTFLIVSGIILNGVPVAMLVKIARSTINKTPQKSRISQTEKHAEEKTAKLPLVPKPAHELSDINDQERNKVQKLANTSARFESAEKSGMYEKITFKELVNESNDGNAPIIEEDWEFKQISTKSYLICSDQKEEFCKDQNIALITKSAESHNQNTSLKLEIPMNGSQMKMNASQTVTNSSGINSTELKTPLEGLNSKPKEGILRKSLNMLVEPTFVVIMLIQGLHAYVMSLVWTTLIDYSRDKGIEKSKELYILMFHPLADLFGRLALGWVTDKKYLSLSKFSTFGFLLMGLSTILIALSHSFSVMMTGALFFAITSGALFSIMPAMVFDFMDKDQHIMGLASRSILYAPLSFTAAPLIGYFRSQLGSYDGLYYVFAVLCFICCCITPLLSVFSKSMKQKKEKFQTSENVNA